MTLSDGESIAAKRLMRAMFKLQATRLCANIICTISTIASVIAPFIISGTTGNWGSLRLLLIYPVTILPAMVAKNYTRGPEEAIGIGCLGLFFFIDVLHPPVWYLLIGIGLLGSYFLLISILPVLQEEVNEAYRNPDLNRIRSRQ